MAKFAEITITRETPLLTEARARLIEARSQLEEAQTKHREALSLYRARSAGEPSALTAANVDELALQIGPAIDAVEQAEAAFRLALADHHAQVARSLKKPLAELQRELAETSTRLSSLIAEGARIEREATRAGIVLGSSAPAACLRLEAAVLPMMHKLLKAGGIIDV